MSVLYAHQGGLEFSFYVYAFPFGWVNYGDIDEIGRW